MLRAACPPQAWSADDLCPRRDLRRWREPRAEQHAPKPRMSARDRRDAGPHARHLPPDPQLHRPTLRSRAGLDVPHHPGARVRPDRQAVAALQRLPTRRHRRLPAASGLRAGRRAIHQAGHRPAGRHHHPGERARLRDAARRITGQAGRALRGGPGRRDGAHPATRRRAKQRVDRARRPVFRDGRQPAAEPGLALLRAHRAVLDHRAGRGCATSRSIALASWRDRSTPDWTRPMRRPAGSGSPARSATGAAAPRPRSRRPSRARSRAARPRRTTAPARRAPSRRHPRHGSGCAGR